MSGLFPDSFQLAFNEWYVEKNVISGEPTDRKMTFDKDCSRTSRRRPREHEDRNVDVDDERQLGGWFRDNPNPDNRRIVDYVQALNGDSQRDQITSGSVANWFENKRRRLGSSEHPPTSDDGLHQMVPELKKSRYIGGELTIDCGDVEQSTEFEVTSRSSLSQARRRLSPAVVRRVPVLPNRNAVYVLDAILPKSGAIEDNRAFSDDVGDDDDDGDEHEMKIICDSDVEENGGSDPDIVASGRQGDDKKTNNLGTTIQEEATDLRVRRIASRSDSGASVGSEEERSQRDSPPDHQMTSSHGRDDDQFPPSRSISSRLADYYSGNKNNNSAEGSSNSDSPTYSSPLQLAQKQMMFPCVAPATPTSAHPLTGLYQHHQRALQLAAMSRAAALGLHLSGHGFSLATQAAAASTLGPASRSSSSMIPDDYRNYGGGSTGNGAVYDRNANLSLSHLRNGELMYQK